MTDEPITVVFTLTCPEPRAWVVLSRTGAPPRVVEMWQPHRGFWSACAVVSPGEYRCRCYGGTDRGYTYCGPARVDGGTECGMDTLLTVGGTTAPDAVPFKPYHQCEQAPSSRAAECLAAIAVG